MTITLTREMKKIVDEKLQTGDFATAEDVVFAALQAMKSQQIDEFEPGELDRLIAEGDESIRKEGTIDVDDAFAELRARRAQSKARRR
jgi:putative addiction module CopG family antidote